MTNLLKPDGLAGCFRCAYVWRPRSTDPSRCPRCKSALWDVPKLRAMQLGNGQGVEEVIGRKRDRLFDALRKNKARNPRVFGSVARRQATRQSDLDLLVDFDPDASIFDMVGLKMDLERVLHRTVDVVEPRGLHWLMRPQILFEATPL